MPRPTPNQIEIQRLAGHTIFQRGLSVYRSGAVLAAIRRGDLIQAEIQGSDAEPYAVTLRFRGDQIYSMECSCPYEYGPVCKHIVALLVLLDEQPDAVEERPPLTAALDELDRDQLRALLLDVAAQHPDIADMVEARVKRLGAPPDVSPAEPIDRQIRHLLRDHGDSGDWDEGGIDEADLRTAQVRAALQAGDGRAAIKLLEAISKGVIEAAASYDEWDDAYDEYDAYGEAEDTGFAAYDGLGELWAEALLSPDIGDGERARWAKKLAAWERDMEGYGFESPFVLGIAAANEGWNIPWLVAAKSPPGADGSTGREDFLNHAPISRELVDIRLTLLARAGRDADYLALAEIFGKHERSAEMLLRQGRTDEAVAQGLARFTEPYQALHLALALDQAGAGEAARRIAAHGLILAPSDEWGDPAYGERLALARTLRDWAVAAGDQVSALDAALTLLSLRPSLADYRAAESIAGGTWADYRDQALAAVRGSRSEGYDHEQAAIFLHERQFDEAIALVDQPYASTDAVALVVSAAAAERPDWAADRALRQAVAIMEGGKAARYAEAAFWLEYARTAHHAAGKARQWDQLLDQLIAQHKRKYKLVPLLEGLRQRAAAP